MSQQIISFSNSGIIRVGIKIATSTFHWQVYNDWPTTPGVADDLLKWKPSSLNTIDFCLKIVESKKPFGELFVQELDKPFATIELTSELEQLDRKIIECKIENGKWILLRARWDKTMANTIKTAMGKLSLEGSCRKLRFNYTIHYHELL